MIVYCVDLENSPPQTQPQHPMMWLLNEPLEEIPTVDDYTGLEPINWNDVFSDEAERDMLAAMSEENSLTTEEGSGSDSATEYASIRVCHVQQSLPTTESCSICLDVNSYIQTNCRHSFCDCIITHCLNKTSCPICRQEVTNLTVHNNKTNFRVLSSCLKYDDRFFFDRES